jgi:hypothetical protein
VTAIRRPSSCFTVRGCPYTFGDVSLSCYITSASMAALFILICTVAILHFMLWRQLRQYLQNSSHSVIVLQITISESFVQEKTNHDNPVASIQVSKHASFPNECGCPLSPSDLEKAIVNDISNRMILLCLSASDGVSLL